MLNIGLTGSNYYSMSNVISSSNANCGFFDSSGNLLPKSRTYLLMAEQLGLSGGKLTLKSTSSSGVTTALAATNFNGDPVVVVVNATGSSISVPVTMNNLGTLGNRTLNVYLAQFTSNTAQTPVTSTAVTVTGSVSQTVNMPEYSVAGLILAASPTPTPQQYTLIISTAGSGSGTVKSSPSGINCGTSCAATYNQGTAVTLTASPAAGSTLTGWSGGGCTGTGTCSFTLNANTTVTATFVQNTYTVTSSAGANGSISPSTAQTVSYNKTKAFTVTPNSGYSISSVTG